MKPFPSLDKTYEILYYPPTSPGAEGRPFLLKIISLLVCIAVVPIALISLADAPEILAFLAGVACVAVYFFILDPLLLRMYGQRTEIQVNASEIRIQSGNDAATVYALSQCTYTCFSYSGSDEASVASITLGLTDGSSFHINRRFVVEGDFEVLLKVLERHQAEESASQ
jgi:hypothetical protein